MSENIYMKHKNLHTKTCVFTAPDERERERERGVCVCVCVWGGPLNSWTVGGGCR